MIDRIGAGVPLPGCGRELGELIARAARPCAQRHIESSSATGWRLPGRGGPDVLVLDLDLEERDSVPLRSRLASHVLRCFDDLPSEAVERLVDARRIPLTSVDSPKNIRAAPPPASAHPIVPPPVDDAAILRLSVDQYNLRYPLAGTVRFELVEGGPSDPGLEHRHVDVRGRAARTRREGRHPERPPQLPSRRAAASRFPISAAAPGENDEATST